MPKVGNKKFPYNKKGELDAEKEKAALEKKKKKKKKKTKKKKGS